MDYIPRLQKKYREEIIPALVKQFNYKSVMQVPRLVKISLNQGLGDAIADKKLIDVGIEEMTLIAGQRAIATKSKKDISNFKLRRNMPVGVKVTLRGARMYEFLDRLISIAIPRIRDFHGISDKGFDGRGNFSFGISEQIIFPEINIDKVNKIMGMDITFVTSAETDAEAYALLKAFGFPFKNEK
ncbi:MAG TPA: 50S ribosomal protein L5 [Bacteroidales bacterium]|jgi:large subunit ribosomal protein L5|nr:MAG: 50S ribosomal protein L5 [Bacteroidetes bacterium ADurb.Bin012]HNQ59227.1 50S ribosomal protein L5 [Bacteroidales bacterium]HNU20908.1 50S ribosomal protein L5 [Bacteroidales bacterium]HNV16345.1 50S ribosomal protein L5 [Bacteroidales bacterium]HNZ78833.1 50S ribosomal protein L5 [Bacteroidales bacterium]